MVVVIESFIAKRNIQELHGHRKAVLHVRFHRALAIKHLLATVCYQHAVVLYDQHKCFVIGFCGWDYKDLGHGPEARDKNYPA